MNTRSERKNGFSLKSVAMVAGIAGLSAALMTPVFAATPSPFNGAFVEGALGGSIGKNKLEVTNQPVDVLRIADPMSPSNKSKSAFTGRLGGGYGYDLPYGIGDMGHRFNLTGMLTYSTPQKVDEAGSKIKNSIGLLFQPGYYLPLNSNPVLIYGTLGYAFASFEQRGRITIDGNQLNTAVPDGVRGVLYYSPPFDSSFRTRGLVLGLGAKYAATDRLYAGFDYTHTDYSHNKGGELVDWRDDEAQTPDGRRPLAFNSNSTWRSKSVKTDTFLLTVGFRFF